MQNTNKTVLGCAQHLQWSRSTRLLGYLGLYIFIVVCLIGTDWATLLTPTNPCGDLASDMLHCNLIRDGEWPLVGHYSRWGFNHPGPFWFLYNYAIECSLNWTGLPRFQIWLIGGLLTDSLLALFSTIAISHYFLKKFNFYYAVIIAFVSVNFIRVGDMNCSIWMPYRLTAPFLALLVCFLHIQSGNFKYLAFAVLLSMILIHSYVTMPLFTIPFLIICIIIGHIRIKECINISKNKWQILLSAGTIIAFSAPILIDAICSNDRGNISKIFAAQLSFRSMPKASWQEIELFCNGIFFQRNAVTSTFSAILLPMIFVVSKIDSDLRKKIFSSLFLCLLVTLACLLSHKQTPTPLYAYVAVFCVSVNILIISTIISPLFSQECPISSNLVYDKAVKIIFGLAIILLICLPLIIADKNSRTCFANPLIGEFANQIEADVSGPSVSIDYEKHDLWPFIVGLLLELDQRGINVCTVQRMGPIYTDKMVCPHRMKPNYKIITATNCENKCLFEKDGIGLTRVLVEP